MVVARALIATAALPDRAVDMSGAQKLVGWAAGADLGEKPGFSMSNTSSHFACAPGREKRRLQAVVTKHTDPT